MTSSESERGDKPMIQPHLKDDDFLLDARTAPSDEDCFHIWWLGQSGYLLKWRSRFLLLDPYLSDSLSTKYADGDKPHIRMTDRVVDPRSLDFIDIVTSSHNHTDHLDPETLKPVVAANPNVAIVAPTANLNLVAERSGRTSSDLIGIDDGQSVSVGDFELHGVAAAHDELSIGEAGHHRFLGYLVRFGDWTIYHSGDTRPYDGLLERLAPFRIDLAMLPINGSARQRRVAGNFWGHEAARLAKDAGVRIVVPCHYDMFSFNTVTPDAFVHACWKLDQPHRVLRPAERWTSVELGIGET